MLIFVANLMERQKIDLKKAISSPLDLLHPRIHGELYYARFADEQKNSVIFEKVFA
jgi:hypothetical protein